MTVRVLFFPCTHMSLLLFMRTTMVTLGMEAGGLSKAGACRPEVSRVAMALLLETLPATRIRRTKLRTCRNPHYGDMKG
jgi:hypothetical protein